VVVGLPSLLTFSYAANIAPSLDALQARLGLSDAELRKVVLGLPQVIGLSYEANLAPSLDALQARRPHPGCAPVPLLRFPSLRSP
jgi:mTERF domain-containing protein